MKKSKDLGAKVQIKEENFVQSKVQKISFKDFWFCKYKSLGYPKCNISKLRNFEIEASYAYKRLTQ